MSVEVEIEVGTGKLKFTRETWFTVGDTDTERYRECAQLLRAVADDVERMYPIQLPQYCGKGICAMLSGHEGACRT